MREHFGKMVQHMAWADQRLGEVWRETLRGEENAGLSTGSSGSLATPHDALTLYAHVIAAERVWLARLEQRSTDGMEIFPNWDLITCLSASQEAITGYEQYVSVVTNFEELCIYRNSTGKEFRTSIADVLTHVFLHGSYHRGQINSRLRGAGIEPVNVDYITFTRL